MVQIQSNIENYHLFLSVFSVNYKKMSSKFIPEPKKSGETKGKQPGGCMLFGE